jgi:hypothetical protein
MAIADVDGDGLIDYNEFVAATMHVSKLEKEELLQKVSGCGVKTNSVCDARGEAWESDWQDRGASRSTQTYV